MARWIDGKTPYAVWYDEAWPQIQYEWKPSQADEELADWEKELQMPRISPAVVSPMPSYAEALEEFLDWTSWEVGWHELTFEGVLKAGTPETAAEHRVALMVAFDKLCKALKAMNAPLMMHPELRIVPTEDGNGFLSGMVTIRLYKEPEYLGAAS
jgi:hypothetical protein